MALRSIAAALLLTLASGCATTAPDRPATADRLYVIDCGENHVTDLSRWTTPADKGKPWVFSDECYLIKHGAQWMMWDTGHAPGIVSMPQGLTAPNGSTTYVQRKTLSDSLQEIGVKPADIGHFAMSHSHPDHTGDANLFSGSTFYIQAREYDAVFGPTAQKFGFVTADFERLRNAKVVKLNGDHDVFGDGSVVIKSTPGHTIGHQSLFVRLPKTGPVLLTGDMVHLQANWDAQRSPVINYDATQTLESMRSMKELVNRTGAKVWINHDRELNAKIPKSPAYIE